MAFQGSLKELPLPDIIQLVSVSGKTGKFTLTRDNDRGFIFLKNGQIDEAIDQFQEAIRLKPDDPSARNNLTRALEAKKNPQGR